MLIPYPRFGTSVKAVPENVNVAVGCYVGPTFLPIASPSISFQLPDFRKLLVSHVGSTLMKQIV